MEQKTVQSGMAGTFKGVYLVRDKNGSVKYDDPHNVSQQILDVLTPDDLQHLETLKSEN